MSFWQPVFLTGITILLENKADINAVDKKGNTPLDLARSKWTRSFLISKGAKSFKNKAEKNE